MTYLLNGEPQSHPRPLTIQALIEARSWQHQRVAVAVNQQVVPRSHFGQAWIQDGDRVEVLQAVGGG